MFVFLDIVWYFYASILFQIQALITLQQLTSPQAQGIVPVEYKGARRT